jgi:hypothetical protein
MRFNIGAALGAGEKEYQSVQNQVQERQLKQYQMKEAARQDQINQGIQDAGAQYRDRKAQLIEAGDQAANGDHSGMNALARDYMEKYNNDPAHNAEGHTMQLQQDKNGNAIGYTVTAKDAKPGDPPVEQDRLTPQHMMMAAQQEYLNNVGSYDPKMMLEIQKTGYAGIEAAAHSKTADAAMKNADTNAVEGAARGRFYDANAQHATAEAATEDALRGGKVAEQGARVNLEKAQTGLAGAEAGAASARTAGEKLDNETKLTSLGRLKQSQALVDQYGQLNDQNDPDGKQRAQLENQIGVLTATKADSPAQFLRAQRTGMKSADDPGVKARADGYSSALKNLDPSDPKYAAKRTQVDQAYPEFSGQHDRIAAITGGGQGGATGAPPTVGPDGKPSFFGGQPPGAAGQPGAGTGQAPPPNQAAAMPPPGRGQPAPLMPPPAKTMSGPYGQMVDNPQYEQWMTQNGPAYADQQQALHVGQQQALDNSGYH